MSQEKVCSPSVAVGHYSPKSVRVVGPRLRSLAASYGRRPLDKFGQAAIERWLGNLAHLRPNSRAAYLASARQFTAWLYDTGRTPTDACRSIPSARRPRSVPRAQSADNIEAIFAAIVDDRERAIFWLMYGLGLRRAEVAAAQGGHWDQREQLLLVLGKNRDERLLPVPPPVAAALRAYRVPPTGPMIRSKHDDLSPVSADRIGWIMSKLMARAGVKTFPYDGVSGHALRHTAATDIYLACHDVVVVRDVLGHASLATTHRYVRGMDMSTMAEAMAGRRYAA